jgi:hypothetical protein
LDKAVKKGDLQLATKLSEEIALKNYEQMVQEAIERKEFDEAKRVLIIFIGIDAISILTELHALLFY